MNNVVARKRSLALAVVAVLAIVGGAVAYWTTTGAGTGSASTKSSVPVTITQSSAVTGMYPGGPAQSVPFTINNPATGNQYVTSVTTTLGTIEKISDGSAATGCTAADFTLVQGAAIAQDLPPGDTAITGAKLPTIRMINDGARNQDACKNVKVNLTFASN